MGTFLKQIIQAVALGTLLPGMVFSALADFKDEKMAISPPKQIQEQTEITQPEPEKEVEQKTVYIPVLNRNGEVTQMDLEDYIGCVVLGEMPASFEFEALKAQSVAARTYTLRCVLGSNKHPQGAVCTDHRCCQSYRDPEDYIKNGGTQENMQKVFAAAAQTAGQVLCYNGELILATYFSSAGGTTEDAREVWGGSVPYLTVVSSPEGDNAYNGKTVSFSSEEFQKKLGVTLKGKPESWFGRVSYTTGGGVDKIRIGGKLYSGVEIRTKLGLRSTDFTVSTSDSSITFTTNGYGHRVGMSQYGADAMAVLGSNYQEILYHYYPGTELQMYEPDTN